MTDHRSPKPHRDPPLRFTEEGTLDDLETELRAMANRLPDGIRESYLEGFDERIPRHHGWESARDRWAGRRRGGCSVFVLAALLLVGSSINAPHPLTPLAVRPPGATGANVAAAGLAGESHAREASVGPVTGEAPRQPQPRTEAPVPSPSGAISTALIAGNISWADPELGGDYLATRFPRGTLVRICAATCIVRRTNDFGPSAAIDPPRIADLAVLDWEQISGLPRSRGLVRGTIETIEAGPTLPPTDQEAPR